MNLYLRLFLVILRWVFKSKMNLTDTLSREMRVLPNDIDLNGHMNNGRYLTVGDLFIIEICLRSGIFNAALKYGWMPILGGHLVTFKKDLKLFEKYRVEIQLHCWDDTWTFLKYNFVNSRGQVAATGYAKGGWITKKGMVPTRVIEEKLGIEKPDFEIPEAVKKWLASEALMIQSNTNEVAEGSAEGVPDAA